jgi:hypothetical protein
MASLLDAAVDAGLTTGCIFVLDGKGSSYKGVFDGTRPLAADFLGGHLRQRIGHIHLIAGEGVAHELSTTDL